MRLPHGSIVVMSLIAILVVACGSSAGPTTTPATPMTESIWSFDADEASLRDGIREDARVACVPIRDDLPPGAIAGVGCRARTDLVSKIGVYLFPDDREATRAYFERLAAYGIEPRSGSCAAGSDGGDSAWAPGDDVGEVTAAEGLSLDGGIYVLAREGCFLDEDGMANSRVTGPFHSIK